MRLAGCTFASCSEKPAIVWATPVHLSAASDPQCNLMILVQHLHPGAAAQANAPRSSEQTEIFSLHQGPQIALRCSDCIEILSGNTGVLKQGCLHRLKHGQLRMVGARLRQDRRPVAREVSCTRMRWGGNWKAFCKRCLPPSTCRQTFLRQGVSP